MNEHKGVNLYAGYQRAAKQKKPERSKKGLAILPLLLLLLAVAAVYLYFWRQAQALQTRADALDAEITQLSARYAQAEQYSGEASGVDTLYSDLVTADALFTLYPALTPELITDVEDCAGDIFTVTAYGFEETSGTLAVNANADSVNEVPKFIERLRDTNDFQSVQYTGYTSDTSGEYFCTVAGVLPQGELYGMLSDIAASGAAAQDGSAAEDTTTGDADELAALQQ